MVGEVASGGDGAVVGAVGCGLWAVGCGLRAVPDDGCK